MKKIANCQYLYKQILLLVVIWFVAAIHVNAQNINIPNKTGPMGLQVNTLTGNLFFTRNDLYIPARFFSMNISFHYNSFNFDRNDGYGNGWNFDYNIKYSNDTAEGKIITWGDGREDSYKAAGGGTFTSPRGFFTTLAEYQPGKFSITETDGTKYFFDNSTHKHITRMEEPNGNFISFSYTDTLLTALTNGAGQIISFAYTNGRLTTVTDAMATPARTFTYTYDGAGNLKEVKDPLNNSTKYSYLVNGPMKDVSDKNSNKVDIIYFNDFTISELIGCNKRVSFSYDTTTLTTIVTDYMETGDNQVTKYEFKKQNDRKWLSQMWGNCCGFNKKFEFDDDGNEIKETDANGNISTFTYDNRGNMLTMTDPLNNTISYAYTANYDKVASFTDEKGFVTNISYDAKGNLTQLTEPGNLVYTATYAGNGDIVTSTDPKGNTFTYNYDAYGNPINVTGPNGYSAQLAFDARGNLLSYTDAKGNTSNLEFDILNRLKKIINPVNNNIQLSYDAGGNPVSLKNGNNETNQLAFDASNRLVAITDPTGGKIKVAYDAMNNIKSVTNALGNAMNFEYDTRNRLKRMSDPDGNIVAADYDPNGNITTLNMPNGQRLNYNYDALNRVTAVNDQASTILSLTYDKKNNVTGIVNSNGAACTIDYDNLDRIKKITDPLSNSYAFGYDNNGNVTSVTDRNGFISGFTYDSLDRVKTMTDNNGNTITPAYDAAGNVITLKDQNNNITNYSYDNLNRLKRTTYADGKYVEYTYDNKSNVIAKRITDGSTISFVYDTLNRAISKTLPDGQVFTYTYNRLGRLLTATNNAGTVTLTYDALNRVSSETFGGRTVSYSYDVAGRKQTSIYPDGTAVTKSYDTRNRLTSITKNNAVLVSYQYNNAGKLISKTLANGINTSYQYDFANRLSNIYSGAGAIQNSNFTYNNEWNKTSVNRLNNPASSEQFTYDNGRRLTNYKRGIIGESPLTENTYQYDALGNRTSASLNGTNTSYTSNALNQLINSNNGVQNISYTYDDNGNLTYDGLYYKKYDAEKRLIKDSSSPANVFTYTYDALNRRVKRNLNGTVLNYTFSGISPIEERDNASGNIINKTIFANFLTPVVNEKNNSQFFYHQNELNSVEAISNQQGRLLEKYMYDAYGKTSIYDSLNNLLPGSLAGNRFGFTGQMYDSATSRYKFFFREYNPETGLFNQRDLIGYADGMGMYQYVHNNPANGVDVLGLEDDGILSEIMDFISNTIGNANSVSPLASEIAPEIQQYIAAAQKGGQLLRLAEVELPLSSKAMAFNQSLKFLNSTELTFFLTPINIIGTVKSYNKLNDPCATDGQKVDASISMLSGGLNSTMGLYVIARFTSFFGASTALGTVGNSLLGNPVSQKAILSTSLKVGADAAKSSFGAFGPKTLLAEAGLGGLLSALAGGLAIEAGVNLAWQGTTGQSLSESAEQDWFNVPGFTKPTEWYFGEHQVDWNAKAIYRNQLFSDREEAYLKAKAKVDAMGSHGGGGHWKAPKPGGSGDPCGESGGTQNPIRTIGNWIKAIIEAITSQDPNEIIGPDGQPDKHWVSVKDRLPYTILFENSKNASAPAKFVRITSPIEPKEEVSTFQLNSFGFNNQTFTVPSNISSYYQRLDCRDSLGLYVDVTAGYDQVTNQAFWEFQSIDPVTLLPPANPLKGFLLQQDSTKMTSGHAFVGFSMKPKTNAITLDTIGARAVIVFDTHDTIPTNIATNTIDAFAPSSHITSVTSPSPNTVTLNWAGTDDTGGCGIDYYTIYVSNDHASYSVLVPKISRTDTTLTLPPDTSYCFFVLATDRVGNKEVLRQGEIQCGFAAGPLPVTWLYFRGNTVVKDNILDWATATEQNSRQFDVERSLNGSSFNRIGVVNAVGNSSQVSTYQYKDFNIDKLNSNVMYYRLKQIDINGKFNYSNIIRLNYNAKQNVQTVVYPNPTQGTITILCGDKSLVGTVAVLYDINGRFLENIKITANTQDVNLGKYVSGVYLIKLSNNEVLKIIKQ